MWIHQSRPQTAPFGAHSGRSTGLLDTAVTGKHKPKHSSNNYLDIQNWREDASSKYGWKDLGNDEFDPKMERQ